jgi:hypothetical protein
VARFYSNENIAFPIVEELRRLGHDVLTSLDAGNAKRAVPDDEVLSFAATQTRILLSHNRRHFLLLHRHRAEDHSGIVLCTVAPDFRELARRIHEAVTAQPDLGNQVVRVTRAG